MKEKIIAFVNHDDHIIITYKTSIPENVNTLNKIYIPKMLYDKYALNFYDDCHVEIFNFHLKPFLKKP